MPVLGISNATINQRAFDQLCDLILSGELTLGERLDERLLAAQMGISRTPLREALGRLANEGIVEYRAYQGNFVRTFTQRQIEDLYEVRKNLEGLAARSAANAMNADALASLEKLVDECRDSLADGEFGQFERADREFHNLIVSLSGNSILIDTLKRLDLHIQLARHLANGVPNVAANTVDERRLILDAFKRSDGEAAARYLERHIETVKRAVVLQLEEISMGPVVA